VRTNNHVERANRKLRYDERARYKFRSERSLDGCDPFPAREGGPFRPSSGKTVRDPLGLLKNVAPSLS
jgi:hypothetical protein